MAYQVKRKKLYTEDFELTEENGAVVHTLHVALDPDSMAKKLSEKHITLIKVLQDVKGIDSQKDPGAALEVVGNAVKDILGAVFGEDSAKVIVDFYDGRYMELCTEVMPFITGTVIPVIRQMAQENKKAIAGRYSRKQHRMFGKR